MRLTERMTLDPCRCLGCGKGNTPDGDTGEIGPFVDLEMEIGWNDHAYLCMVCASMAGALAGMITEDEAQDLKQRINSLKVDLHEAKSDLEETTRRLRGTQKKLLRV